MEGPTTFESDSYNQVDTRSRSQKLHDELRSGSGLWSDRVLKNPKLVEHLYDEMDDP